MKLATCSSGHRRRARRFHRKSRHISPSAASLIFHTYVYANASVIGDLGGNNK